MTERRKIILTLLAIAVLSLILAKLFPGMRPPDCRWEPDACEVRP